jgi:hypothetical protein
VHTLQHAAARGEGAQDHQEVGGPDQDHIPNLENAALLLDDDAVQEGGGGEPGQEGGVLHRVPRPVAAPTQLHVGPLAAHDDAQREEHPRHQRPTAHGAHPFIVKPFGEQGADRKGERHRHADIAEIEHDRMNHHPVVLQERIEALAVGRHEAHPLERIGRKDQQHQEKERRAQQHRIDVGHDHLMALAIGHRHSDAVERDDPAPEEQAAGLTAPERREFIENRQRPFRVIPHIAQLEGVGQQTVPEQECGQAHQRCHGIDGVVAAVDQLGVATLTAEIADHHAKGRQDKRGNQNQKSNIENHRHLKAESYSDTHPFLPG